MRRSFISVSWTPGVDVDDAGLLIRTIEDIYDLLRPHFGRPGQFDPMPTVRVFGDWMIPAMPPQSAYSSMDWYMRRSLDDSQAFILASRYLRMVSLEPWQASYPHLDLCLTNWPVRNDLPEQDRAHEAMGFSRRGLVSLVSTHRLEGIGSPTLRRLALRHLFAHYIGQMFDVPDPARAEHIVEVAGDVYCDSTCALRFTPSPEDALKFGQQQAGRGLVFCKRCQRDLVARLTGYHYGLN